MSVHDLIRHLSELDALRDRDTVETGSLDSIQPDVMAEWPTEVRSEIRAKLADLGLQRPYRHQYYAVQRSLEGRHVVLESPTASGKTLAFTIPILDALRRDPDGHALLIYPMKALAFDQHNQLSELGKPLEVESFPYDGDTPDYIKSVLRSTPCHCLFTTPDYLNMAFLGYKEQWIDNGFLPNLRYVVIDEMHEYRGYFGTNAALLFRRLFTLLDRLGTQPIVFLSTATCANPAEHAKHLTGLDVELVSATEVLRPRRHFVFVRPAIPDFKYMDILRSRIVRAALTFWKRREQVLVFCPSKRFLEHALRQCRHELEEYDEDPTEADAFHADIKGDTKQDIQQRIRNGRVRIVFTTNALELGIDIGGLDAIILAGFPATIMSAWQQIGRAGRKWDKDAYVVAYAMNDPIDSFFVANIEAFLDKPFDELVVDPSNQDVIDNHVPSLIKEVDAVRPSDEKWLGPAFYKTALEADVALPSGFRPQLRLPLRGMYGNSFRLMDGGTEIGDISELRRFREAYIGAIFPFRGQHYVIKAHQAGEIVLGKAELNRRTEPVFFTTLHPYEHPFQGIRYDETVAAYYGAVSITHRFEGYHLVNTQTDERIHYDPTKAAMSSSKIHAFWLESPAPKGWRAAAGGVEHMMRIGSLFVLPIDRFDVSTYSTAQAAYCYERHSGGIGIANRFFSVWGKVLREGIRVAENCSCRKGCPNCIVPAKAYDISRDVDKAAGLELARQLLARHEAGPTHYLVDGFWRSK